MKGIALQYCTLYKAMITWQYCVHWAERALHCNSVKYHTATLCLYDYIAIERNEQGALHCNYVKYHSEILCLYDYIAIERNGQGGHCQLTSCAGNGHLGDTQHRQPKPKPKYEEKILILLYFKFVHYCPIRV